MIGITATSNKVVSKANGLCESVCKLAKQSQPLALLHLGKRVLMERLPKPE